MSAAVTDERLLKVIGKRVRDFRLKAGLTQEDMMSHGFERRYYQRIESGTVNLSLKSLNKLAKAFRVSFSELMHVD
jgi:transcriptional regulator with XRE-family HTH domain